MRKWWLLVAYVLVVTPIGLVMRVVRDPLRRRWAPSRPTYFTVLDNPRADGRS